MSQPCKKCGKSILWHRLHGTKAYCGTEFGKDNLGTFSVTEVNTIRRQLGHPLSDTARMLERREQDEAKKQKVAMPPQSLGTQRSDLDGDV